MLEKLNRAVFSDVLGSTFRIHVEDQGFMDVDLVEAVDLDAPPIKHAGAPDRQPFSLVFRGPKDTVLPQRIYKFEHASIGKFDMFIVPIGPDDRGMQYQAIFS